MERGISWFFINQRQTFPFRPFSTLSLHCAPKEPGSFSNDVFVYKHSIHTGWLSYLLLCDGKGRLQTAFRAAADKDLELTRFDHKTVIAIVEAKFRRSESEFHCFLLARFQ